MTVVSMEPVIPLVDLAAVHRPLVDDLRAAFERVLASSAFTGGNEVEAFEAALSRRLGGVHVVGVGSGTAALRLALVAAGIGPGDEVILPTNDSFATAEAVIGSGATPVLVDVDPETALLDAAAVEAAVTHRTTAVIGVHLYGQTIDADRFGALATRSGLLLLEGAAQALGASWDSRPAGTLGHIAGFSFSPTKGLGALGDAGAVTTNDEDLARRVRLLRSHGEQSRHVQVVPGLCERLDGLQAAFLAAKLPRLDVCQAMRDDAVGRYRLRLEEFERVRFLGVQSKARHVYNVLVVQVPHRDEILVDLNARGIGVAVHYPTPIHLQPACRHLGAPGAFPNSEALAASVLSLPLYPGLTNGQLDRIVDTLTDALARIG